ncbi:hypothetical protein [Halorhabdus rudnickae]|uniref:hypothetical protein n=1 Tax=Halorhabdus rudnickae TaxID=1775544 RepID=UPI001438699E|nr:hypothetical protein [Halorhabdus rudnickae]
MGLVPLETLGLVLALVADPIVGLFTTEPSTRPVAVSFAVTSGIAAPPTVLYTALAGV